LEKDRIEEPYEMEVLKGITRKEQEEMLAKEGKIIINNAFCPVSYTHLRAHET